MAAGLAKLPHRSGVIGAGHTACAADHGCEKRAPDSIRIRGAHGAGDDSAMIALGHRVGSQTGHHVRAAGIRFQPERVLVFDFESQLLVVGRAREIGLQRGAAVAARLPQLRGGAAAMLQSNDVSQPHALGGETVVELVERDRNGLKALEAAGPDSAANGQALTGIGGSICARATAPVPARVW